MGGHYVVLKICKLNGPRAGKGVAAFAVLECRNSLKGSLAYILSGERTGKTRRARAVDIGNRLIFYGVEIGTEKEQPFIGPSKLIVTDGFPGAEKVAGVNPVNGG